MPLSPATDHHSEVVHDRLQHALAGRYVIESEIGRGGMATVYRARDLRHDRPVAVKVLPPQLATAIASERFLFEIRTAAGLTHPHILGVIDSGESEGLLYYIMPLVSGESLRVRLRRTRQLAVADALCIARDVASALGCAHEHGVLHRDIKPENILLVDGTTAVVADFGLARALLQAAAPGRMTLSRNIVGTAAYMSPEQGGSGVEVDGRADIYSLGVVLFEMLAGHLPFSAETELALLAQHMTAVPPRLATSRRDVPRGVQRIVDRALAKSPSHRYQTAQEFHDDLELAIAGRRSRWWMILDGRPARRRVAISGVLLGATAAAATLGYPVENELASTIRGWIAAGDPPPADSTRFAVFPMAYGPGVPRDASSQFLLADALRRWRDLTIVAGGARASSESVGGIAPHDGGAHASTAREAGAAWYFHAEAARAGPVIRVRVGLFASGSGTARVDTVLHLARSPTAADSLLFQRVIDDLLVRASAIDVSQRSVPRTSSYRALLAFRDGHAALREWSLGAADSAFSRAVRHDPAFAAALVWLAQTRSWAADEPSQWRGLLDQLQPLDSVLSPYDRALASAMRHTSEGSHHSACDVYRGMRQSDPHDFTATFGLGECVRRDSMVVPDPATPSGWRFRGSRHEAVRAYRDAFQIRPSIHRGYSDRGFARIRSLLFTATSMRLEGRTRDGAVFRAAPTWEGDSLQLIPWPSDVERNDPERVNSATSVTAVNRQRELFRDLATEWRRAFPDEVAPVEAMAIALELMGDERALDTLAVARRMATTADQRRRLAVEEVWLRVKFALPGDVASLAAARRLADSLRAAHQRRSDPSDETAASLALLTGHVHAAAALARLGAEPLPRWPAVPIGVIGSSRALLAYAAAGGPADSIATLRERIARAVGGTVAPHEQTAVLQALLTQAAGLAFAAGAWDHDAVPVGGNPLLRAQQLLAAGDPAGARRRLDDMERRRRTRRAADLTLDVTLAGAWTLAQTGDTAAALRWLDPVLGAAQLWPSDVVSRTANAGALVRAMAWRAELALAQRDTATARSWAHPVTILWARADAPLQPVVQRMNGVVGSRVPATAQRR